MNASSDIHMLLVPDSPRPYGCHKGRWALVGMREIVHLTDPAREQFSSMRDRPKTRIAAITAIVLIGASVLVAACSASGEPTADATRTTAPATGKEAPATAAEITLTGLDVEMHYADG